jgi:predicted DNA-binding transcriptional regulator AlpA
MIDNLEILRLAIRQELTAYYDTIKESLSHQDIIGIDEVMKITGLKKNSIYTKVSKGELPTLSRRRPLRFSKKAIIHWIKN